MKNIKLQFKKYENLKQENKNKSTSKHRIVKLQNTTDKEKIHKSKQGKR